MVGCDGGRPGSLGRAWANANVRWDFEERVDGSGLSGVCDIGHWCGLSCWRVSDASVSMEGISRSFSSIWALSWAEGCSSSGRSDAEVSQRR